MDIIALILHAVLLMNQKSIQVLNGLILKLEYLKGSNSYQ